MGVLRRVQTIADDVTRAATEQFQKLTSKGSTSCALHSFITLVLGRFVNIGELKPGQRLASVEGTPPQVVDVQCYAYYEPVSI